ncbi:MAG TPA: glycosyltransferase [Deltaproteobacteria bacterium]|nr:glycosyltransferase [Deltaproteobacteria bacterium]HQI80653.1 glycosyltransferase [Deltaproteobacteria bacterium]
MAQDSPRIGVVIIGVNVERYIGDCIGSVLQARYPRECIEIVYVDGGSRDHSAAAARRFPGVRVIELNDVHPTPGRGRNAGWRACTADLVQFLDADTRVDPDWFARAVPLIGGKTAAVCGMRRERFPRQNLFHTLTDLEWRFETGPCRYFGGDVLITREALLATRGFDEELVAGEDPELSYRVRHRGWQILRIDAPMTTHDINMSTFGQYVRRAYRSGYAYAEIALRFMGSTERLWLREFLRITARSLAPVLFVLLGAFGRWRLLWFSAAAYALAQPLTRVSSIRGRLGADWRTSLAYACHATVVVFPQFAGILRYFWARITGNRLLNKGVQAPE